MSNLHKHTRLGGSGGMLPQENSNETSGPLSNGRILKLCSLEVYIKSFGGQKGGSLEPPRIPPAYGPSCYYEHQNFRRNDSVQIQLCISHTQSHAYIVVL